MISKGPTPWSLKSTTTQPAVGGPKTFWEDQRAWRPKNLAAQRAERTKVLRKQTTGRTKKYLTNRWDTEKLNISLKTETTVHCEIIFCEGSQNTKYALLSLVEFVEIYALFGRTKQTRNLRWEDQNRF